MKRSRMGLRARFGVPVAVCGLVAALSAGAAVAHKVSYDNNLQLKITKIDDATSQYSGKVTSTRGACEVGRPVTVSVNGAVIASGTSVVGGAWSASGPAQPKSTTVIATIPRKILKRNKKHKHKCKPASAQKRAN
jgi:hypothetical protein